MKIKCIIMWPKLIKHSYSIMFMMKVMSKLNNAWRISGNISVRWRIWSNCWELIQNMRFIVVIFQLSRPNLKCSGKTDLSHQLWGYVKDSQIYSFSDWAKTNKNTKTQVSNKNIWKSPNTSQSKPGDKPRYIT